MDLGDHVAIAYGIWLLGLTIVAAMGRFKPNSQKRSETKRLDRRDRLKGPRWFEPEDLLKFRDVPEGHEVVYDERIGDLVMKPVGKNLE